MILSTALPGGDSSLEFFRHSQEPGGEGERAGRWRWGEK